MMPGVEKAPALCPISSSDTTRAVVGTLAECGIVRIKGLIASQTNAKYSTQRGNSE